MNSKPEPPNLPDLHEWPAKFFRERDTNHRLDASFSEEVIALLVLSSL
jgi:hypothetical protein